MEEVPLQYLQGNKPGRLSLIITTSIWRKAFHVVRKLIIASTVR